MGMQRRARSLRTLVPEFERMYELALKLNAKRHRRGSIDFDLPEPVIQFDPEGNMEALCGRSGGGRTG